MYPKTNDLLKQLLFKRDYCYFTHRKTFGTARFTLRPVWATFLRHFAPP